MLFTIYVADLFQIIEKHLPEAQGYADDHQVYLSFRPIPSTNQTVSVTAIENMCGRTEELDDFQHAYVEWQQDRILDCRK